VWKDETGHFRAGGVAHVWSHVRIFPRNDLRGIVQRYIIQTDKKKAFRSRDAIMRRA